MDLNLNFLLKALFSIYYCITQSKRDGNPASKSPRQNALGSPGGLNRYNSQDQQCKNEECKKIIENYKRKFSLTL